MDEMGCDRWDGIIVRGGNFLFIPYIQPFTIPIYYDNFKIINYWVN